MQHLSGVTVQGPDLTSLPEPSPLPPAKQYQSTVTQHPCVSIPTPCHLSDNINQLSHSTPVSVSPPLVTCQTVSVNCHTMLTPLCQYSPYLVTCQTVSINCYTGLGVTPVAIYPVPCHLLNNISHLSYITRCHACVSVCHTC